MEYKIIALILIVKSIYEFKQIDFAYIISSKYIDILFRDKSDDYEELLVSINKNKQIEEKKFRLKKCTHSNGINITPLGSEYSTYKCGTCGEIYDLYWEN